MDGFGNFDVRLLTPTFYALPIHRIDSYRSAAKGGSDTQLGKIFGVYDLSSAELIMKIGPW